MWLPPQTHWFSYCGERWKCKSYHRGQWMDAKVLMIMKKTRHPTAMNMATKQMTVFFTIAAAMNFKRVLFHLTDTTRGYFFEKVNLDVGVHNIYFSLAQYSWRKSFYIQSCPKLDRTQGHMVHYIERGIIHKRIYITVNI